MAHALLASLDVVDTEPGRRRQLRDLASYLRASLADAGLAVEPGDSHIVPVHIGENAAALAVAAALQADGFDVRAIRPPTVPPGTARLRLSVNTGLDAPLLAQCVRRLSVALKEAGSCSGVSS